MAPRATAIKEQGSIRSVYEAKWCLSNQVDFRAPPLKAIADFLLHLFKDKKLQLAIDGYRSTIAEMSAKMRISLVFWIASRETGPWLEGHPLCEPFPYQLTKASFEPLKEASLKYLTFKIVFLLVLLALGSGKHRSEIIRTSHTSQTGLKFLCTPQPAFFPRTSWLNWVQTVWPRWLYQPWPLLWIYQFRVIGPYVPSEPCVITWTGPQILGRTRSWSLSPSRKVFTRTSHLPLSPHGSSRL